MAYIDDATPARERSDFQALRERYADERGDLDRILRIHALDPPSLELHYNLYRHAMTGPSPLSRAQREMIAVVVSAENDCFY